MQKMNVKHLLLTSVVFVICTWSVNVTIGDNMLQLDERIGIPREPFMQHLRTFEESVPIDKDGFFTKKWSSWTGAKRFLSVVPVLATELGAVNSTELTSQIENFVTTIPKDHESYVNETLTSITESLVLLFGRKQLSVAPYLDILESFQFLEETRSVLLGADSYHDCLEKVQEEYDNTLLGDINTIFSSMIGRFLEEDLSEFLSEEENYIAAFESAYKAVVVNKRLKKEEDHRDFRSNLIQCRESLMKDPQIDLNPLLDDEQ